MSALWLGDENGKTKIMILAAVIIGILAAYYQTHRVPENAPFSTATVWLSHQGNDVYWLEVGTFNWQHQVKVKQGFVLRDDYGIFYPAGSTVNLDIDKQYLIYKATKYPWISGPPIEYPRDRMSYVCQIFTR